MTNENCKYFRGIILILLILFPALQITAKEIKLPVTYKPQDSWKVVESESYRIEVNGNKVVREKIPRTLLGFNVNTYAFQKDFWDKRIKRVNSEIVRYMSYFDGALLRYPGGTISNLYQWDKTIGPLKSRKPQEIVKWEDAHVIEFGIDEFFEFAKHINGQPIFVLNLHGTMHEKKHFEKRLDEIYNSNKRLASHLVNTQAFSSRPHYYQLGNELDRSTHEWPHEKYIERSLAVIKAIKSIDGNAKFIAFLRDFNWRYRSKLGLSTYQDFITEVLTSIPEIGDFSLHHYYDGYRTSRRYQNIHWKLNRITHAIETANSVRGDTKTRVWITEHARAWDRNAVDKKESKRLLSNLGAAISTSDFLISIMQISQIQGTALHGLNAGPWQVFDASIRYRDLRPRPIYWALRVLNETDLENSQVLETLTYSPNQSNSFAGYDIRAVALRSKINSDLNLWVVNRKNISQNVTVHYKGFSGKKGKLKHNYIAGQNKVSADDINNFPYMNLVESELKFNDEGVALIELPASSVSSIKISLLNISDNF